MDRTGTTRPDMGRICIDQRRNAGSFSHALFRQPLALEAYLAARPIAEPLHLFDCVLLWCGRVSGDDRGTCA
jgi:acetyl-CoA acetyltransferase